MPLGGGATNLQAPASAPWGRRRLSSCPPLASEVLYHAIVQPATGVSLVLVIGIATVVILRLKIYR